MNNTLPITVAMCGYGSRAMLAYTPFIKNEPTKMKLVAGADIDPARLSMLQKDFVLTNEQCFNSAEEMLKQPKLADIMLIATQDRQHVEQALLALEQGYDLIVEKPISPNLEECLALQKKAHETNRTVVICHVLRYSKFYATIHDLLKQKVIGKLQTLDAIEHVAYWHFAHSFVRGSWRDANETSPSILAKCCHDMDIIRWLVDKPCLRLSSFGSLSHFNTENAPAGSSTRCVNNCTAKDACPYDSEKIYLTNKETGFYENNYSWLCTVLSNHPTETSIKEALKTGNYGRCVYHCDNNVADHQVIAMDFADNITATFTMSAFTKDCYRTIKLMGSLGEIEGHMEEQKIWVRPFLGEEQVIDLSDTTTQFAGHGGGDAGMMNAIYDYMTSKNGSGLTSVDVSVESHIMALLAEKSRLSNGACISLSDYKENQSLT